MTSLRRVLTMTTAKRIQYHRYGGPEVLRLEDFRPA